MRSSLTDSLVVALAAAVSCTQDGPSIPERVAEICGDYCAALDGCGFDSPACPLECQEALEKSPEEQIDDCANRLYAFEEECDRFFRWIAGSDACAQALEADDKIVGQARWNRFRGDIGADGLMGIVETDDGYVVAGTTSPDGEQDAWIFEIDQQGEPGWEVVLGGDMPDSANTVRATGDGFVAAGWTQSDGDGELDSWVVKLDAAGGVEWDRTLGVAGDDRAADIGVVDGGFLVAGHTGLELSDQGVTDSQIWRLDDDGAVLWQTELGEPGVHDWLEAVHPLADGGCVAAGYTESPGNGDGRVLRLDAGGEVVWDRTVGGDGRDELMSVWAATDAGFLVAGAVDRYTSSQDAWVLAIDDEGETLWERRYGPNLSRESAWSIHPDEAGGFVFSGTRQEVGGETDDVWVVAADANGEKWLDEMVGLPTRDDLGAAVVPTRDAGYVVAATRGVGASGGDAWVLKLDGSGQSCTAGTGIYRSCYDDDEIWSFDECDSPVGQEEVCSEGLICVRDACVPPACRLSSCTADGFFYSCATLDYTIDYVYGGPGPDGVASLTVSYTNLLAVTCTYDSATTGTCTDGTSSCDF
ncbi:MAG: PQQ-like beta-propeller repeat protein [Deltaproteobacteria bacterium]|nr:PQQ-like beta-propeller repeat protein [Deltaproteobacteria bacterium]